MKHTSPETYDGQPLCPRCGQDANGDTWPHCCDSEYSCEETCATYFYIDLCPDCCPEVAT